MANPGAKIRAFGEELPGVTYVERPGAYAIILNERDEIAVVKTSYGYFLPGGGLDPGEEFVDGLARELDEEIGYQLVSATYFLVAAQFHWSEHYQKHFKKIGAFFEVEAQPPSVPQFADGHSLVWMPRQLAARDLSQEFQRWAVQEHIKLRP
jgi:8-oxo-dGTP diphosphatase